MGCASSSITDRTLVDPDLSIGVERLTVSLGIELGTFDRAIVTGSIATSNWAALRLADRTSDRTILPTRNGTGRWFLTSGAAGATGSGATSSGAAVFPLARRTVTTIGATSPG
ncbi:MAG: hypothetical protein WCH93_10525, partial [Actinomycetota bacterium]